MRRIGMLLLCALAAAGCHHSSDSEGLSRREVDFLREDVRDLSEVAFQVGENAYLGDGVSFGDVIAEASANNGWTVTYELPADFRLGLGFGLGRVHLSVVADGVAVQDPLGFSFATTDATDVRLTYDITYEGETIGGRLTDISLEARLHATRPAAGMVFLVDYWIVGDCWFGETFCRLTLRFDADGLPRNLRSDRADAAGVIDDPDVRAEFELDYDFGDFDNYVAEGWVGCCAWFRERFTIPG